MDFIRRDEIRELMRKRSDNSVSIFLPTHRAGKEIEQDPIRLDNLLRRAEKELTARGMRSPIARQLLAPAFDLVRDGYFTRHQSDGLSIFAAPDFFRYYQTPIHFNEMLTTGRRFHLKPLLPMLNTGNRFYIFAVSQKTVRFLQCSEFGVSEIELEGVPGNMREALGYDDTEARLLFRTVPRAPNNRGVPMFHGHGGGIEDDKEYLRIYFHRLREGLHPYLRDEKAPLVFAGVDYLLPIFRQANIYHNLLREPVEGNPDGRTPEELHMRALEIVRPYFEHEIAHAIRRYENIACNGQCTNRLEKVLRGAFEGRVDTLLVDTSVQKWGKFDPISGALEIRKNRSPEDEDLIDLATVETFLTGGTVYPLETERMPESAEVSAIFRY